MRRLEAREAADRDGVVVMPGAVDLLRTIPRGLWSIVTSGSRSLATGRLQRAGVPIPKIMVTADDVVTGKPDPEPYMKGAELLGANPSECLVIEDAPAGIRSAHAAAMNVIGLTSTYPAASLQEADTVITRLDEIKVGVDDARTLLVEIK